MSLRVALGLALLLLVLAFVGQYFFYRIPTQSGDNFNKEFSLVFSDYEGKEVPLYEFRRQNIVAYAWASWCTYCGEELKRLAQLKKTYGDKIQIVAVNRAEPEVIAKEFTAKLGLGTDIKLLLDPQDTFFKSIGGYAMPETVFINPAGEVVYHQRGPLDLPTLEVRIKELLE